MVKVLNDAVTDYAQQVVAGKIVAGPHVRASCQRHIQDIKQGAKRGLYWDLAAANRAIGFFHDVLRLSDGQFDGKPFDLEPSQAFIVGSIFGWKRGGPGGPRRFYRAYVEQGKGNGKSPLAAGIGLYGLTADREKGAEIYSAASKMDQARIVFNDAVKMVRQSPALATRLDLSGRSPVTQISNLPLEGFFKPMGRDTGKTGSGYRPHFVLADELHEHPNRDTIDTLERGFKFREQPLIFMITNSGSDRTGVCFEEHEHAVAVAHGDIEDDTTFSYVCALDDGDDPLNDPSCWIKANPLLDVTIPASRLAEHALQAKNIPARRNRILRWHFCVWTDADKVWIPRDQIEPCLREFDPVDRHRGRPVWIGVDLSRNKDITALAVVAVSGEKEIVEKGHRVVKPIYDAWVHAWTPGDTLAVRSEKDKLPYQKWVDLGDLYAPPGQSIRFDHVAQGLWELNTDFDVQCVAYDRYAFRSHFEPECRAMGLDLPFVEHPQAGVKKGKPSQGMIDAAKAAGREPEGLWMPSSLRELEDAFLEDRIRIVRNEVLFVALLSAVTDSDRWGNKWLAKERTEKKIDAAVALCMAIGAASVGANTFVPDVSAMIA